MCAIVHVTHVLVVFCTVCIVTAIPNCCALLCTPASLLWVERLFGVVVTRFFVLAVFLDWSELLWLVMCSALCVAMHC